MAQALPGLVFGPIDIALASPLTAAVMILIKALCVEVMFGDPVISKSDEAGNERSDGKRTNDAGDA